MRARRPAARPIVIVAENEPQDTRLVRPIADGGYGLDALWNDDFHHSAMVALTGRNEAYYTDYRGDAAGVHLGARSTATCSRASGTPGRKQPRRGTPALDLPPTAFVTFLQNHDQVANSGPRAGGATELTSPGRSGR